MTSDELDEFDPALFGLWTHEAVYGDAPVAADAELAGKLRELMLEVKSAENPITPTDDLRRLLNEMTVEMRDQFATFRRMRALAEAALEGEDEAARKLARADVKAATDAMSLIVRTLEKVDSLQRQLARDREVEAERTADRNGYEEAVLEVERLIEQRSQALFRQRCIEAGLDPDEPAGARRDRSQPPDDAKSDKPG